MASFLESVSDFLFGGEDDSAQRAQAAANAAARGDILGAQGQGRADVLNFIPSGQRSQAAGFQSALDLLGQSIPAQADIFQQGNLGAQQNILAGLPQQNAAILGNPIDLSGLQARALEPDLGFVDQNLPVAQQPQTLQGLLRFALGGGGATPFFSPGAASGGPSAAGFSGGGSSGGSGIGGNLLSLASGPIMNALGIPTPTSLLTSALGGLFGGSAPAGALASGIGGSAFAAPSLGALSGGGGLAAGSGAAGGLGAGVGLASILGPAAIIGGGLLLGSKIMGDKPINMDRGNALLAQFQKAISPGGVSVPDFLTGAIGPGDVENFDIMASGGGFTDLGQPLPPMDAFQLAQFESLRPQFISALERKAEQTIFGDPREGRIREANPGFGV